MWELISIGAALCAVVALISFAIYKARRDPIIENWRAPPMGTRWEHCGRVLTVIDDGWLDDELEWRDGVACHYPADDGTIERVHFTPAQWAAVVRNNPGGDAVIR